MSFEDGKQVEFDAAMSLVEFCKAKGWTPDDSMLRLVVATAFSCIVMGASKPAREMLTVAIDALDMYRRMLDRSESRKVPS